jgi:hypothetical protein
MKESTMMETLKKLLKEFSSEELINRIIFIEKVEKGLQDAEDGNTISLEEARSRINKKWSK